MNKKIVVVANSSGGLYRFRKELLVEMMSRGYKIVVFTPLDSMVDELKQLGIKLIETPLDRRSFNPITDIALLLEYLKLLREEHPNLVMTYTIKPNIYGGIAARLLHISYAVNITGLGTAFQSTGILRLLVISLYKIALKKVKVVFFENMENCKTLIKAKIVKKKQCCVLNGAGVNLKHYPYVEYPIKNDSLRFLFIGRIMREKGVNELFEAMKRIHSENKSCILDMLGYCEENYKMIIRNYEGEGWLRYHGYQENINSYIADAHCFVLPSWHEGMSNSNLECASSGRPIITSNIAGCREAIIDNISGLLCEPRESDSLYKAMKHFISLSYEVRKKMGLAGRKHMELFFDKNNVIKITLDKLLE